MTETQTGRLYFCFTAIPTGLYGYGCESSLWKQTVNVSTHFNEPLFRTFKDYKHGD